MAENYRIVIIGSGPAGISAATHAAKRGLSHVLLEKTDHLSDTIFRYQKGKHIMATPNQLVLRSDVHFQAGKREDILDLWTQNAADAGVNVRYNAEVNQVSGQIGNFSLTLTSGEIVLGETIILALGTQGNPNLMRCDGSTLPHIQYSLDDPAAYVDEHIFVFGGGDAGIENAMGLAADPAQGNIVTLVNRSSELARAKDANIKSILSAQQAGRIAILHETTPSLIEPGFITLNTPQGSQRLACDRVIARLGSPPPRQFVESMGVEFTSESREAFPKLSPTFETTTPGIHVIGALAGYPLIKHCMNQGYDVVEFIAGNTALKPADEPILEAKLKNLPGNRTVAEWLEFLRTEIEILSGLSALNMREFLLDSEVHSFDADEVVFARNSIGSSLFGIADGGVLVQIDPNNAQVTVPISAGSIFGEVGLISGRRRGATIRASVPSIVMEIPRTAALKLMATSPEARAAINRITTERHLLQIFKSGMTPEDLADILATSEVIEVRAGQAIITEGELSNDVFIVRSGSLVVERTIAGNPIFLSYLPAGSYVGEMALIDNAPRNATVKAAVKSQIVKLNGSTFEDLLKRKPKLAATLEASASTRRKINGFIEQEKSKFGSVVDMYSSVAGFLIEQGLGEATDVLLIDEKLCIGCDNCEKACADIHDGLSRLDREAGKTYAQLHVPTSCRHCEHPYCMTDCPANAIHRGPDGEVFIDETCIGCGNCQRNCPYDVIRMDTPPAAKPSLLNWMLFGAGPGPGEPDQKWKLAHKQKGAASAGKVAIKCDMCKGKDGGPACVRACPTGAAIRISPENFLSVTQLGQRR